MPIRLWSRLDRRLRLRIVASLLFSLFLVLAFFLSTTEFVFDEDQLVVPNFFDDWLSFAMTSHTARMFIPAALVKERIALNTRKELSFLSKVVVAIRTKFCMALSELFDLDHFTLDFQSRLDATLVI